MSDTEADEGTVRYVPVDEYDPETDSGELVGVHYELDGTLAGYHVKYHA